MGLMTNVESARLKVGMEIHVELRTRTKMFTRVGSPAHPDYAAAQPNTLIDPLVLGLPGSLPVPNRQAVELSMLVGLALGCTIATRTRWDRKSYFYPDLPKNYQISQYDRPLAEDGFFEIPMAGGRKHVRIRRAHLEEDAGKNIHDTPGCTLVDLNRAGTPLLEIVTEPDLCSADEAYAFCTELQRLVTYLGVSEGNMQKGQMRFEPNVNLAITHEGREYRTPISEIKNLNSFRAIRGAVAYETKRQLEAWREDHDYVLGRRPNENRGWNDDRGVTEFQRPKEAAQDYRYFPDPDLPAVEISDEVLEAARALVPELPIARRARLQRDHGICEADAETIVADRATAETFDLVIEAGGPPAVVVKQFVNVWLKLANERAKTIGDLGVSAEGMARLARMTHGGAINKTAANRIAAEMVTVDDTPEALAARLGLLQERDETATAKWVDEALAANESAVADATGNPKKAKAAIGFLRGQVMKCSGGKADPRLAGELIERRLAELRGKD
ncbi:MAG: Asp-tRNA(Asn)/Glu-tRNA(Gln) amidotransferase subunit GatB [Planctomycetes bacterium]|nr:Asp-tRNA(Asn)/Glu-tRNA(Gln) amidotransferase subunit GatB [Planctomycetota bacterium]